MSMALNVPGRSAWASVIFFSLARSEILRIIVFIRLFTGWRRSRRTSFWRARLMADSMMGMYAEETKYRARREYGVRAEGSSILRTETFALRLQIALLYTKNRAAKRGATRWFYTGGTHDRHRGDRDTFGHCDYSGESSAPAGYSQ